jgi:hypothetical protein
VGDGPAAGLEVGVDADEQPVLPDHDPVRLVVPVGAFVAVAPDRHRAFVRPVGATGEGTVQCSFRVGQWVTRSTTPEKATKC